MSSFTLAAPIAPKPPTTTLYVRNGTFDPTSGVLTWISSDDPGPGGVQKFHTATLTAPQLAVLVNLMKATMGADYGQAVTAQAT